MKRHQFYYHLLASAVLFFFLAIFLIINGTRNIQLLWLFLGIAIGTVILDTDHLIYWLFLKPNSEESRIVKAAFKKHDFVSIIKLINIGRSRHHNLIFHHYFFQIVLVLFSLFILTSSNNIFTSVLTLSINLHLIIDELIDYLNDPKTLQNWLFAREPKQLPIKFLKRYLIVFTTIFLFFVFLFLKVNT